MFRAGARNYSVRVTDGPIIKNGVACMGSCDNMGSIKISEKVPLEMRLQVLLHELAHAHIFQYGEPSGVEAICDFFATASLLAIRDIMSAGGEEALRRLRPGESFEKNTSRVGLSRQRSCACGGTIAPGDIWCAQSKVPNQVDLKMYCEFCDRTMTWSEMVTFGGLPSGIPMGEQVIERGNTMSAHHASAPSDSFGRIDDRLENL